MNRRVIYRFLRRNRVDIWHVFTPTLIASFMATSSLAGAAVFLVVWVAARGHNGI